MQVLTWIKRSAVVAVALSLASCGTSVPTATDVQASTEVESQLFDSYEFRNVTSSTGRAGAEVFLGEVRPTGSAQTGTLSITKTISTTQSVTTGFGIGVDGALEFAKGKVGANGKVERSTSTSYTASYTQALTSAVALKAGEGVRFYGYLTGRYYSYDVRKCSFGCSSWLRQTVFIPEGIGIRPQVFR